MMVMAPALQGCSSFGQTLKGWMGGSPSNPDPGTHGPPVTSYNNTPNVMVGQERKYKRVTKDNFADDQKLEDNAGSLWRREGQGSYLFSQNNLRIIGDIVSVQVEGKAAENLTAKLTIIKTALAKLEAPIVIRRPASQGVPKPDGKPDAKTDTNAKADGTQAGAATDGKEQDDQKIKDQIGKFDEVPCRIVEKNPDGSYRIKGQSPIYVGRREYRLIVTGVVRPEDLSSDQINSGKMLESKFDLVATNKEVR